MRWPRHIASIVRSFGRCSCGAALVEWTLVLPFLLTLGLGFMEFGHALYQYQQIANGLRDASRYLSRLDVWDPDVLNGARPKAQNLATRGTIDTSGDLRVPYWEPEDVIVPSPEELAKAAVSNGLVIDPDTGETGSEYRGGANIYVIEVTTSVTYDDIGFLDFFGLGPITFSLRHEERVIGE